jgi:hypothetical protein
VPRNGLSSDGYPFTEERVCSYFQSKDLFFVIGQDQNREQGAEKVQIRAVIAIIKEYHLCRAYPEMPLFSVIT